ncbi:MAG: M28 family peptidase [Candidatus Thorarchaeota archaeon]
MKIILIVYLITLPQFTVFFTGLTDSVPYSPTFSGENAYAYLLQQCELGPRLPGSVSLQMCRQLIGSILESAGWNVTFQYFIYRGVNCSNIVAIFGSSSSHILVGAHYDTRPMADRDPSPEKRTQPVLGANDGASGVAVLLELARCLPVDVRSSVKLVFFDAEDSGHLDGWEWIRGSTHYVSSLTSSERSQITAMILLDMVGASDLSLLRELSSTRSLQNKVWELAHGMGYHNVFIDSWGASILDDHRPFLDAGIPALDIIQHSPFPSYWHTTEDTPDKCSATSLKIVGDVTETFLVLSIRQGLVLTETANYAVLIVIISATGVVLAMAVVLDPKRRRMIGRRFESFTRN